MPHNYYRRHLASVVVVVGGDTPRSTTTRTRAPKRFFFFPRPRSTITNKDTRTKEKLATRPGCAACQNELKKGNTNKKVNWRQKKHTPCRIHTKSKHQTWVRCRVCMSASRACRSAMTPAAAAASTPDTPTCSRLMGG